MKIYFYRPQDDQFWIGCTLEEAIEHFMPEMEEGRILQSLNFYKDSKRENRMHMRLYRQLYGLKSIKDMPDIFFNVSRDLKVCFSQEPFFPIGPMWNGYCPFRMCDQREIENPKELLEIEMTLDGKPYSEINWEEEGWL